MSGRIDAVLLDLGNVLVLHDDARLFRALGKRAGLTAAEVARRMLSGVWASINVGGPDEARVRAAVNAALGTTFEAGEFFELFNSHFTVHEAVLPLVERLIGRVRLGLLSNTNPVHARWVRARLPVLRRFDAVVLSFEEGVAKPDPRIYRAALERLGTSPDRTLFFDDIAAYVDAARALGMQAEVFTAASDLQKAVQSAN